MSELSRGSEIQEAKPLEVQNFRDITPESNTTVEDAKSFVDALFSVTPETNDGYYNSYEDRMKHTPGEPSHRGTWEGERGESKFIPTDETEEGQAAKDRLAEYDMDGVQYKNAEPDFSPCTEATVSIDNMTQNRNDYFDEDGNYQFGNFSQADMKCADMWNNIGRDGRSDWTAEEVRDWRRENCCSWHERCDTQTMDLVSRDIHGYFTHSGGVSECKARDAIDLGGGFDE